MSKNISNLSGRIGLKDNLFKQISENTLSKKPKDIKEIAKKHNVQIPNVATRFILDRPAVAGTIIGSRLGLSDHIEQNTKTFSLQLQNDDYEKIKSVTSKANDLFTSIGDCGGEYR